MVIINSMANHNTTISYNKNEKEIKTIFANLKIYPYQKNDLILTEQFLETCKGILILIDHLGKTFSSIKHDIQDTLIKLQNKYEKDKMSYKYIQHMLLAEKEQGESVAIIDIEWLKRDLTFIMSFLNYIVVNYEEDVVEENLVEYVKSAYSESLERYHGWLGSQLFSILCKFLPSRTDLFKTVSLTKEVTEEEICSAMKNYVDHINMYLETLTTFYGQD